MHRYQLGGAQVVSELVLAGLADGEAIGGVVISVRRGCLDRLDLSWMDHPEGAELTPDWVGVLYQRSTDGGWYRVSYDYHGHTADFGIRADGREIVIHAGDGGLSGNKTAGPTVVDIASMAVSPGGDVFLADNTQLKIFSLDMSNNGGGGQSSANNVTTVIDRAAGQSYQFNNDGLHVATRSMATGQLAYTFHYTTAAKGKMPPLARIEDQLGNQVTVIRDVVSSRVEAIQNPLGITFPVKLNKQGRG